MLSGVVRVGRCDTVAEAIISSFRNALTNLQVIVPQIIRNAASNKYVIGFLLFIFIYLDERVVFLDLYLDYLLDGPLIN